jgi:hypothetical protein
MVEPRAKPWSKSLLRHLPARQMGMPGEGGGTDKKLAPIDHRDGPAMDSKIPCSVEPNQGNKTLLALSDSTTPA